MKIFSVECHDGCETQHLTATHRAQLAKWAHELQSGHSASISESEVAV